MSAPDPREDLTRQREAETAALAELAQYAARLEDVAGDVAKAASSRAKRSPLTREIVEKVSGASRDFEAAVEDLWIARNDLATSQGEHT